MGVVQTSLNLARQGRLVNGDTGVKGRTQINLAVSYVCHHCYDCVKRAVGGDLCHNNIILLPYFLLLSKIQKMFMVLVYTRPNFCIN